MPDKRSISTKWLPRQGMKKAPVVCRDIRQATGGLWESRERRRVRVAFMAKWVRLHPSEPLLWGNALHSFDFQLFRFLSCYFLFITQKHHTFVWRFCCASFSSTHFGGVGGIRTLGPLLTATRFPVVLVMTTSILLHIGWARQSLVIGDTGGQQKLLYQIFRPRQGLFLKKAEKRLRPAGAGRKCGPGGADVGCTGSPAAPPAGRRSPCLPPCPAGGGRRGGTGPRR